MTNRRHKGICLIINNELYDRARAANKGIVDFSENFLPNNFIWPSRFDQNDGCMVTFEL